MQAANAFGRLLEGVRFALNKRRVVAPPSEPLFEDETREAFDRLIENAQVYVEYGAGGATLVAARTAELVISVENDGWYKRQVDRKIRTLKPKAAVELLHVGIGPTAKWGEPIFHAGKLAPSGRAYASAPWKRLERMGRSADLILVDGRYRMLCVLSALLSPQGRNAIFLIDDFSSRAHYDEMLGFLDVLDRPGPAIVARRGARFDESGARLAFEKYVRDWR